MKIKWKIQLLKHFSSVAMCLKFSLFISLFCIFLQLEESEVEALVARGHNVTFLQAYEPKNPNPAVREFCPSTVRHIWEHTREDGTVTTDSEFLPLRLKEGPSGNQKFSFQFPFISLAICDKLLSDPETLDFVNNNKIDLVVIDSLWNECAYGLAHKWNAKTIVDFIFAPDGVWGTEALGFLGTNELWVPDNIFPFRMPLSFFARLGNAILAIGMHLVKEWFYYPRLEELFRRKLHPSNMPALREMIDNTSLVFHNSHFSEEYARSLPPLFVPVPGMHAWTKKTPLPKDIADFIDSSDGFVYVSFGGEADVSSAPQEFQDIFIKVFARQKMQFIWKRIGDRPTNLTENVLTKAWMPQKDILASPKCRAFITHAGLLGIQEAIMNGVPMVALPIFAEQEHNGLRIERTGRGIKLEISTLTENQLENAIAKILTDKSYKMNAEKVSRQFKDVQNNPIDTAVFWTEYTLRNDDMSTLRPMSRREYYWFQIHFIDVWAFLIGIIFISFYSLYYTLRKIITHYNTIKVAQKLKQN